MAKASNTPHKIASPGTKTFSALRKDPVNSAMRNYGDVNFFYQFFQTFRGNYPVFLAHSINTSWAAFMVPEAPIATFHPEYGIARLKFPVFVLPPCEPLKILFIDDPARKIKLGKADQPIRRLSTRIGSKFSPITSS